MRLVDGMTSARESRLLVVALITIFLFAAFVATCIFNAYPYSMDEYSVMIQAGIFADGTLAKAATPYSAILSERWMISNGNKIFSKYPPALAAFLAIPLRVGIPQLLNPFLSTLTAFFVFRLSHRHFGSRAAWLTLAILGTSPYFYPYAASLFPQPLALCLATFCVMLLSEHISTTSLVKCFFMGVGVGTLFLARQLDAACLLVVLALGVGFATPRESRRRSLMSLGVGTLPGLLLLFLYNYAQSGKVSISAFSVWNRDFAIGPAVGGGLWTTCRTLVENYVNWFFTYTVQSFYVDLLPFVGIPLFSLFVLGLLTMRAGAPRWAAVFILMIVGAYVMHPSTGWPQYGQRYWYVCFGAFMFIAAQGIATLEKIVPARPSVAFYAVIFGTQIVILISSLSDFERRFALQEAVWRDIAFSCPERSIVVLKKPSQIDVDGMQFFVGSDFKRNSPRFGERLIVHEVDDLNRLRGFFPDYPVCPYDFRGGRLREKLPGFPPRDRLSILR